MSIRNLQTNKRPSQSGLGYGQVSLASTRFQPSLRSPSGFFRTLHIDLIGTLACICQNHNALGCRFKESTTDCQIVLFGSDSHHQFASPEKCDKRSVTGQNAYLPLFRHGHKRIDIYG